MKRDPSSFQPPRTGRDFAAWIVAISSAALLLSTPHAGGQEEGRPLALTHATVIDGTGTAPVRGLTVLIEGERIADMFLSGTRELPAGTLVRDLAGRTVIPGLIDAHIHLGRLSGGRGEPRSRERLYQQLERMFAGGVLTVREMGGDMRIVAEASRSALEPGARIPDIRYSAVMAGPYLAANDPRTIRASVGYAPGTAPWIQAITPETDLRLAVARAAGTGATGLKILAQVEAGRIASIRDEASRQGLRVWAHATVYPDRPIETVRAGVHVLSHACGLGWQDADVDPAAHQRFDRTSRPGFDPRKVEADSPEMRALFAEMARRGTLLEPTLATHLRPGDDRYGCTTELMVALARAAHAAGVRLVAGTDSAPPEDAAYPALQTELEALVDHGILTPLEAITAATHHGALALGLEADLGTVETGKLANLVILGADPSRDIRALREVGTIVERGVLHPRREPPDSLSTSALRDQPSHPPLTDVQGNATPFFDRDPTRKGSK